MANTLNTSNEMTPRAVITSNITFSTPIKRSLQGSQHFYSGAPIEASEFQDRMAQELRSQWVGPMPVGDFMKTFLPLPKETISLMPAFADKHFETMSKYNAEKDMYNPFIELVDSSNAMPGFKLLNTSVTFDPTLKDVPGMKIKPDISCYKNTVNTTTTSTKYEDVELILEFKAATAQADPFNDPTKSKVTPADFQFENKGELNTYCRGQIACYARVWMAQQHRTHCFMIWIGGPHARLIRLDRSGGVVSERFHFESKASTLLEFLWRFSITNDESRGSDPTVTRASPEETALAKEQLYQWKRGERSVFKFKVYDPLEKSGAKSGDLDGKSTSAREFLVWGPLADPQSVTGRATRGYPALDISSQPHRVVFIKDSWRSCDDDAVKESDILRDLKEKGVRNVPEIICGDDLPGEHQKTFTHALANKSWNLGAKEIYFVKRAHSRFAENFVGIPLYKFQSAEQFFQAVYDALIAHRDAYEKCGLLHRDISAGNVLMKTGGGGILNDWDLARYVEKDDTSKHHPVFRSGTWQFMSVGLLSSPSKIHVVQDDLESFFWLVLYHTLRYMKHSKTEQSLVTVMDDIFDQCNKTFKEGLETGGAGKAAFLTNGGSLDSTFKVVDNQPLTEFCRSNRKIWRSWYIAYNDWKEEVTEIADKDDISFDEASSQVEFVPPPETVDHSHMVSLFEKTLASKNWPPKVEAVDYLSKTGKRMRDENNDDAVNVESRAKSKRSVVSMERRISNPRNLRSTGSSNRKPNPAAR